MKTMGIEALLSWAFGEELCKIGAGGSGPTAGIPSSYEMVAEMAALGTLIDKSPNGFGVVPGWLDEGEPHPDAMIVGRAVKALAERGTFEVDAGWNPVPEWDDPHGVIGPEVERIAGELRGRGSRLNGKHVVNLVITCAILKRGPDWGAKPPKVAAVTSNGKDAWFITRKCRDRTGKLVAYEDNGFSQRSQRPVKGAYRKYRLTSSIRGAVMSRLDWQLWQSALEELEAVLQGRLTAHQIERFFPNRHPWATMRCDEPDCQPLEIIEE